MIVFWIIVSAFAVLLTAVFLVSWKLSDMLLHPKTWDYYDCIGEEADRGHFTREWFENACPLEEFMLPSRYGYDLHCAVWPRPAGTSFPDGKRRVAVIVHGYTYCLIGSVKYARIFHDLGFDCVLYDHRNHGLSGKAPTSMGYYESRDLSTVCGWALERFGKNALIGTHGESMGAATVMLQASYWSALSFAIEDCGYSDLRAQLKHNIRQMYRLPYFPFVPLSSLITRLRGGMFFGRIVPKDSVAKCVSLPMLFIHGDRDDFVPYEMVHEVYAAKPGMREIQVFPKAEHAASYSSDPQAYRTCITEFLKNANVI
jgi:hypothetical protein